MFLFYFFIYISRFNLNYKSKALCYKSYFLNSQQRTCNKIFVNEKVQRKKALREKNKEKSFENKLTDILRQMQLVIQLIASSAKKTKRHKKTLLISRKLGNNNYHNHQSKPTNKMNINTKYLTLLLIASTLLIISFDTKHQAESRGLRYFFDRLYFIFI